MSYQFISTPSHGYLMVSEEDYRISGYKASAYSYRAHSYVYLEEDCDASGFLRAAGLEAGQYELRETHVDYDITEKLDRMSGAGYVSPYATT